MSERTTIRQPDPSVKPQDPQAERITLSVELETTIPALTSGACALGIVVALIGGQGYESADDWAALAACVIIVINAFLILKCSLHDVMDGNVSSDLYDTITAAAASTAGVRNTEKCRMRKSGISLFVEIHIRVDPTISVFEGHEISHRVKERLLAENNRIQNVIIHIGPAEIK